MMLGEYDFMDKCWMYEELMWMFFIMYYLKLLKVKGCFDFLINNMDFVFILIELVGGIIFDYM